MRFVTHHPLLILAAIALSLTLSLICRTLSLKRNAPKLFDRADLFYLLTTCLVGFIIWGYLLPKAYYFPSNSGVVGDNYLYMHQVLSNPNYYNPQHLSYPWIPGKLIQLASAIGVLSQKHPLFFEKAFLLSTFPAKTAMIFSFGIFFLALSRARFHRIDTVLATLMLAGSYSCWLWGHQSNALGISLAAEIVASSLFLLWWTLRRKDLLIALGFSLTACIYAHASTFYFVLGGFLYVVGYLSFQKLEGWRERLAQCLAFLSPILVLATFYYWLAGHYVGSFSPHRIFVRVADTSYLGEFAFRLRLLPKYAKDNIVTSLMNITNNWAPQNTFDQVVIGLQLTVLFSLFLSLLATRKRFRQKPLVGGDLLFFAITSSTVFLGFLFRGAGTHYYTVAVVPNLILFLLLILRYDLYTLSELFYQRIRISMLIVTMILYSGFSSWDLWRGTALSENVYYRVSSQILQNLGSSEKALYFRSFDFGYLNGAVRLYYERKFLPIEWKTDASEWKNPDQLGHRLKETLANRSTKIFISDEVLQALRQRFPTVQSRQLENDVNLLIKI